jgi:hypothetical protein
MPILTVDKGSVRRPITDFCPGSGVGVIKWFSISFPIEAMPGSEIPNPASPAAVFLRKFLLFVMSF